MPDEGIMATRVLTIGPNGGLTKEVGRILADENLVVQTCHDAKMALAVTLDWEPNVVICAADMPVLSGADLARLFKSHESLKRVPFLILTDRMPPQGDLERAGFRALADDFIQFPVSRDALLEQVRKWASDDGRPLSLHQRLDGPFAQRSAARQAKPWNKGRVSPASMARLLLHLIRHGETGLLRLKGERRQLKLLIQSGAVVEIKSNYLRDTTLGRFLVQLEKITPRENDASRRLSEEKSVPQGQALVMMNVLEPNELEYYLTQQNIQKILHTFTDVWRGAAFHFTSERLGRQRFSLDPIPLLDTLRRGILEIADAEELYKTIQRFGKENCVMHLVPDHREVINELRLDAGSLGTLGALDNTSIQALKRIDTDHFESYLRLAFLLLTAKALVFGEVLPEPEPVSVSVGEVIGEGNGDRFPTWNLDDYQTSLMEGRTFFNRGDFRGAQHFVRRALEMNPESSEAMGLVAWCMYELSGRQNITVTYEAKELLKKAISLDDDNDEAYLLLGRIFKAEGKDNLSHTHFKRANEINPANEEARREGKLLQVKRRRARDLGFRH